MHVKLNTSFLCHVGKEEMGQLVHKKKKKKNIACKICKYFCSSCFKTHFPETLNLILELESPKYLDCLEEIEGTKPISTTKIQDNDLNMTCNETYR